MVGRRRPVRDVGRQAAVPGAESRRLAAAHRARRGPHQVPRREARRRDAAAARAEGADQGLGRRQGHHPAPPKAPPERAHELRRLLPRGGNGRAVGLGERLRTGRGRVGARGGQRPLSSRTRTGPQRRRASRQRRCRAHERRHGQEGRRLAVDRAGRFRSPSFVRPSRAVAPLSSPRRTISNPPRPPHALALALALARCSSLAQPRRTLHLALRPARRRPAALRASPERRTQPVAAHRRAGRAAGPRGGAGRDPAREQFRAGDRAGGRGAAGRARRRRSGSGVDRRSRWRSRRCSRRGRRERERERRHRQEEQVRHALSSPSPFSDDPLAGLSSRDPAQGC